MLLQDIRHRVSEAIDDLRWLDDQGDGRYEQFDRETALRLSILDRLLCGIENDLRDAELRLCGDFASRSGWIAERYRADDRTRAGGVRP